MASFVIFFCIYDAQCISYSYRIVQYEQSHCWCEVYSAYGFNLLCKVNFISYGFNLLCKVNFISLLYKYLRLLNFYWTRFLFSYFITFLASGQLSIHIWGILLLSTCEIKYVNMQIHMLTCYLFKSICNLLKSRCNMLSVAC